MDQDFPPFSNLVDVATRIGQSRSGSNLRRRIDQAWRANSCLGDLKQAEDCCRILLDMVNRKGNSPQAMTIERALFFNGVSLYSRATSTNGSRGSERGSIQLEKGSMTKQQWDDHRLLIDLRNQAIAHVHEDRSIGSQVWHRSLIFAVQFAPGKWRPAAAANQTSFNQKVFEALNRATPIAYGIILKKFHRRMKSLLDELNETSHQSLLESCAFDPVEAFGSRKSVTSILNMADEGLGSLWLHE